MPSAPPGAAIIVIAENALAFIRDPDRHDAG